MVASHVEQHAAETIDPAAMGRRLQEARKARGLTQREVAESLAVARTTVTALEKGERQPRPGELIRMARLYGRAVSDFVGRRETMSDFSAQLREKVGGTEPLEARQAIGRAVQQFQQLCEDYLYLENLNGVSPRRAYPSPYPVEGATPEGVAKDVASSERNRLALGDGPLVRLEETLEGDVGLRVFSVDLPSNVTGIYSYTEQLGGCIAVNARHIEERRRWTMAREYGHFLTRRFRPEISVLDRHVRVPAPARFADAFACEMLMPSAGLRRRFNGLSRAAGGSVAAADICLLAHRYAVSIEAMAGRLEQLRLIPGGSRRHLRDGGLGARDAHAQTGSAGRPCGDTLLPTRYRILAVRAYEEGSLTEGELVRLLRVDRASARRVVQDLTNPECLLDGGEIGTLSVDLASGVGIASQVQPA